MEVFRRERKRKDEEDEQGGENKMKSVPHPPLLLPISNVRRERENAHFVWSKIKGTKHKGPTIMGQLHNVLNI